MQKQTNCVLFHVSQTNPWFLDLHDSNGTNDTSKNHVGQHIPSCFFAQTVGSRVGRSMFVAEYASWNLTPNVPWTPHRSSICRTNSYTKYVSLAILRVCDLFGMVMWPFQALSDLQRSGMKISRIESPGWEGPMKVNHLVLQKICIIAQFKSPKFPGNLTNTSKAQQGIYNWTTKDRYFQKLSNFTKTSRPHITKAQRGSWRNPQLPGCSSFRIPSRPR